MKKNLITLLLLVVGVTFFVCINSSVTYKRIAYREQWDLNTTKVINLDESLNIWDLVHKTSEQVEQDLVYSKYNNIFQGKANCVGYAQYYSYIFNQNAKLYGIEAIAKPVVGYVYFPYGMNLTKILQTIAPKKYKNFVKNHDYVEIYYQGNKLIDWDPCLNDLL